LESVGEYEQNYWTAIVEGKLPPRTPAQYAARFCAEGKESVPSDILKDPEKLTEWLRPRIPKELMEILLRNDPGELKSVIITKYVTRSASYDLFAAMGMIPAFAELMHFEPIGTTNLVHQSNESNVREEEVAICQQSFEAILRASVLGPKLNQIADDLKARH
jgi:hypothetical protein